MLNFYRESISYDKRRYTLWDRLVRLISRLCPRISTNSLESQRISFYSEILFEPQAERTRYAGIIQILRRLIATLTFSLPCIWPYCTYNVVERFIALSSSGRFLGLILNSGLERPKHTLIRSSDPSPTLPSQLPTIHSWSQNEILEDMYKISWKFSIQQGSFIKNQNMSIENRKHHIKNSNANGV